MAAGQKQQEEESVVVRSKCLPSTPTRRHKLPNSGGSRELLLGPLHHHTKYGNKMGVQSDPIVYFEGPEPTTRSQMIQYLLLSRYSLQLQMYSENHHNHPRHNHSRVEPRSNQRLYTRPNRRSHENNHAS